VGGHLDDNVRHAITKLAHIHFTVCEDSYDRVLKMGEEEWRVFNVGSPVIESTQEVLEKYPFNLDKLIRPREFNVLCTYHPITTESDEAGNQFESILAAFQIVEKQLDVAYILTYPNNESGSNLIVDKLQKVRTRENYFVFEDLGWKDYLATLARVNLMVGNSSSAMLEAPILGVPALDVGTRQRGRYSPSNVHHVEAYDAMIIAGKMRELLIDGRYPMNHPYGDGTTSQEVYATLARLMNEKSRREILQKRISY
jgi:GDP/UDP-N,N'-diacetylbacillosamine 2-epimerase (hydrolysing)